MSWFRRLLQQSNKPTEIKSSTRPEQKPTAVFDSSKISGMRVTNDLRKNIELLVGRKHVQQIFDVILHAPQDQHEWCMALMKIEGVNKDRAVQIARSLSRKTRSMMDRERCTSLGLTHAKWIYSIQCINDLLHPMAADIQQDSAHRAADGKRYEIRKGLFVDGKWTWPGREDGCNCSSRAILPDLEK